MTDYMKNVATGVQGDIEDIISSILDNSLVGEEKADAGRMIGLLYNVELEINKMMEDQDEK